MRPTVDEQLAGTCRILEDVVLPDLSGDYPIAVLRSVIANLRMLERGWDAVLPFLHWDNAAMAELLAGARGGADPEVGEWIEALPVVGDAVDPYDLAAADARNVELRQALCDLIRRPGSDDALRERIVEHLTQRTSRFPMRMSLAMPSAREEPT